VTRLGILRHWVIVYFGQFLKITGKPHIFIYILGDFFPKLIWSPWKSGRHFCRKSVSFTNSAVVIAKAQLFEKGAYVV
jgi:hypothetical protein